MPSFVRFRTREGAFAVPVEQTREVRSAADLAPLPDASADVAGMLRVGDLALTVLESFGSGGQHVLVLDSGGRLFGLLVNEVQGVAQVAEDRIGPAPSGQESGLIGGVVQGDDGVVLVLDVAALAHRLQRL